jgi:hypothetical protein
VKQDGTVMEADSALRGSFPCGFDPSFPEWVQAGFMNRNSYFSSRNARGNNSLDTLIGIVVLICIITPRNTFMTQEEQ